VRFGIGKNPISPLFIFGGGNMYVFQRAHVTATGKGFIAGQALPDDLLTEKQIGHLVADGLLLKVVSKEELFAAKPV
jgi:hypothetical protein